MRLDYISSFVDSAQNVMEGILPTAITRGEITLMDSLSIRDISATIFLVGGVDGRVVLDLEKPAAKRIAGFMNNAEFDSIDHLVLDTICELNNIIIGKAITSLNDKGYRFKPSPPCFFIGEKRYFGLEAVCINLTTDWGSMRIQAAITERTGVSHPQSAHGRPRGTTTC
ncbi:MAG: chemotaxis protein CheX [Thermodesulfovibrionales bacterium]